MKKLIFILFLVLFHFCFNLFAQWERCDNGLNGNGIFDIQTLNDTIISEGLFRLYVSSDNGDSWSQILYTNTILNHLTIQNNYIAISDEFGINYSVDFGKNWNYIKSLKCGNYVKDFFSNSSLCLIDSNLYISELDMSLIRYSLLDSICNEIGTLLNNNGFLIFQKLNNIFFATPHNTNILFYSKDGGLTWNNKDMSFIANNFYFDGYSSFYQIGDNYLLQSSVGIFELDSSFNLIKRLNIPFDVNSLITLGDSSIILATNPLSKDTTSVPGIYYSDDLGNNWVNINKNLDSYIKQMKYNDCDGAAFILAHNDKYIFLGIDCIYGQGMIYRMILDKGKPVLTDVKEINEPIENFSISPSPAETYISLNFPFEFQNTQIKIYSVEGFEVYNEPSEGFKPSEGYKIDVSRFSAGVYYVKIGDRVCRFVKI